MCRYWIKRYKMKWSIIIEPFTSGFFLGEEGGGRRGEQDHVPMKHLQVPPIITYLHACVPNTFPFFQFYYFLPLLLIFTVTLFSCVAIHTPWWCTRRRWTIDSGMAFPKSLPIIDLHGGTNISSVYLEYLKDLFDISFPHPH